MDTLAAPKESARLGSSRFNEKKSMYVNLLCEQNWGKNNVKRWILNVHRETDMVVSSARSNNPAGSARSETGDAGIFIL